MSLTPEQPEQEPIGWLHRIAMKTRPHDSRWVYAETASVVNDGYVVLETRRAYTSPPIVSLSDEWIKDIAPKFWKYLPTGEFDTFDYRLFARAIEAELLKKAGA